MPAVEVIDLTTSPTNSVIVIDEDSHETLIPTATNDLVPDKPVSKKKRKKRPKAKAKQQTLNDESNTNTDTIDSNNADQNSCQTPKPRGKKRKRNEKETSSSQPKPVTSSDPSNPPFAIDTVGQPLGNDFQINHSQSLNESKSLHTQDGLLLPSHVSVTLIAPAEELYGNDQDAPTGDRLPSPLSDASGIEFYDDALAVGVPRYFHDATTSPRIYKTCKRCGDNDHDSRDCPNIVCLTCGARNEHNSRSCPILRYCFHCQGKGHVAKDCPRIGPAEGRRTSVRDCDRCGSPKHHTTNCPTLWRIYTYLTDTERDAVLADRGAKRDLPFDEGGEGFIASDHWCYNCGRSGHLGDDCGEKFKFDRPEDDSAFGLYNCLAGPFASGSSLQSSQHQRAPRPWELAPPTRGGIPLDAQEDIGRKGREKAKKKAREAQDRLEDNDDDDVPDWFNRNHKKPNIDPKPNSQREASSSEAKRRPLVFRITAEQKDPRFDSRRDDSRPALLSRIDMEGGGNGSSRYRDKDSNRDRDRKRDGDRDRKRDGDRDKRHQSKNSERDGRGRRSNERRWKGGYDR